MKDIEKKKEKIEKKIVQNREDEKKYRETDDEKRKINQKNLSIFWDEEFKSNKLFIKNLENIKARFKKLYPDREFSYEIIIGDIEKLYKVLFRLESDSMNIELCSMVTAMEPLIQLYSDFDLPNTRQHLRNYKFDEIQVAKKDFLEEILKLFELFYTGTIS